MADAQVSVLEAAWTFAAKWLPAILGSAISLRFIPAESSKPHAIGTMLGGFVTAVYAGPAIAEVVSASARIEAGIVFACGLFGLAAIGQMWLALKDIELATIAKDAIRKLLGLGG